MGAIPPYTQDPNHIVPTTGWWWAAAEGGRGYSIEVNVAKGTAFVAAYVYDANGNPQWYVASLTGQATSYNALDFYTYVPVNTPYSGTLMIYSGGETLNGVYKAPGAPQSAGNVTLTFDSSTSGTITWPASLTTRATSIVRYPENGSTVAAKSPTVVPQNGWWWNPATPGVGFFWEVQGNMAFIAAYMYGTNGSPVWYVAGPNTMTTPNSFTATASLYTGGPTFANPTNSGGIVANPVGALSVNFSDAANGTLSIAGGAPIPITRFTSF
jgi:hypothetical protein